MKRFFLSVLTAVMAIAMVGCEYDDSELTNRVNNLEDRVVTLEQLCSQMNTNITAMQAIVNALQTQDAITAVTPITEGGKTIGYTITFAKGEPITIYHGQNGKDGADGEDGYTPVIGVDQDEDGVYYWTLDGEWLTDAEGNKIATSGKDGEDGADGEGGTSGMPELKIQGGYWYVSYDGGENWERLGRATGYDGADGKDGANGKDGDAFFASVEVNEQQGFVTFYFTDDTDPIKIPLYKAFKVEIVSVSSSAIDIKQKTDVTITYSIEGCANPTIIVMSDLPTSIDKNTKTITVKAPDSKQGFDDNESVTLMVSNGSTTVMVSVDLVVAGEVLYASSVEELHKAFTDAGKAGAGDSVINLKKDTYDASTFNWTSITVDGYNGADVVTLLGNGSTIKGLKSALFSGGFAGGSGIVIKDLTIEGAEITATHDDTGDGAFVCAADSMDEITLENCHLINSNITGTGKSRIGGLVGWTAGYSKQNDGPVKTYVTIRNCSVIGCTLKGAGTIGAINGHAGASDWTYTTIENCVVKDNKLISTDSDDWRVGVVVGTANAGEVTINNITESGNTLEQTGKTAPTGEKRNYYGRFVPSGTGKLVIDGTSIQ